MKKLAKFLFVGLFMLTSVSMVNAQNYKYSIGAVVGTMDGASFKMFFSENLALQADLAFKYTVPGVSRNSWVGSINTFELNPNLLYQKNITSFDWGALDWYAGGGLALGYAFWSGAYYGYGYYGSGGGAGKFGINGTGGVELCLTNNIPLAFNFDFRPGYGLLFNRGTVSYFDWALTWGVRYYFK